MRSPQEVSAEHLPSDSCVRGEIFSSAGGSTGTRGLLKLGHQQPNARDQLQVGTTTNVSVLVSGFGCVRVHPCIHDRGLLLEILSEAEIPSKLITPLSQEQSLCFLFRNKWFRQTPELLKSQHWGCHLLLDSPFAAEYQGVRDRQQQSNYTGSEQSPVSRTSCRSHFKQKMLKVGVSASKLSPRA